MKSMKMFITDNGIYIGTTNDNGQVIFDVVKTDMLVDKYGNININCILLGDADTFDGYITVIELSVDSPYFKAYKRVIENIKDEISSK